MLRSILSRLWPRSGDDETSENGGDDGASGFLISPLDASVLFAHGKDVTPDEDASELEETARLLEEERREE